MTNFSRYLLPLLFAVFSCWVTTTRSAPARSIEAVNPGEAAFSDLIPLPASHNLVSLGTRQINSRLEKGKFLVASRQIRDPRFRETVILLVRHDSEGSLGLIVNRPTTVKLSDLVPEIKERTGREHFAYIGGPVGINQVLLLIRSRNKSEGSQWIFDDVHVSDRWSVFEQLIKKPAVKTMFRAYAGHAGWGTGQLEREVLRGDWQITDADAETIFKKPASEIWRKLNRENEPKRIEL